MKFRIHFLLLSGILSSVFTGGVTAPNTDTCYYDGTTTTADALIALTNNQENYAFIQFTRLPFILAIASKLEMFYNLVRVAMK